MPTTSEIALELGAKLGWVCVPLYRRPDGRWAPPYKYTDLLEEPFDAALWERLWGAHPQAPGVGAVWPADVVEVEADSDEAAEWLRKKKPPRTPTFSSRRGPHYLFRGNGARLNPEPFPRLEVLSRDGGKRLLVLPPTGGKCWLASLGPFEVGLAPLPSWCSGRAKRRKPPTQIVLGPELPPGEAHREMVRIVGKLAGTGTLSPEELLKTARGLSAGRLPEPELDRIVSDIAAKEEPEARAAADAAPQPSSANGATVQPLPEIARDPRILDRFAEALRAGGVVGEDRNAKLVYLAVTSRMLGEPVSEVMKGLSSSGKSKVVEATLAFFPEEACLRFTGMSEHALFFSEEDFAHRTIVVIEATALREGREKSEGNQTAYYIRSLLSEGEITYRISERGKDGRFVTRKITKHGPVNVILTTTATSLHGENETRMLSLPTNDTPEQTRRVLRATARKRRSRGPAASLSGWIELQRWLATQPAEVDIPFAEELVDLIPEAAIRSVRLRRDFNAVLGLIEAHALLHRASRDRDEYGRVVATLEDYEVVRELVREVIATGLGATVPETVRETVEAVREVAAEEGVTAAAVARSLGLDKSAGYRRVQVAREAGYLVNKEDRRGQPGRYVVGEPMPDDVEVLPRATDLRGDGPAGRDGGCTVAEVAEGGSGVTAGDRAAVIMTALEDETP